MSTTLKFIQYNRWANAQLTEQIKSLPVDYFTKELGGSFPSLRLACVHLVETDWIWLQRWTGIPSVDTPNDWNRNDPTSLFEAWSSIQLEMEECVNARLNENENIHFKTRKGDPHQMPFIETVIHCVNHGTYHRGQIANMIRILGEKPMATDYFIFTTLGGK